MSTPAYLLLWFAVGVVGTFVLWVIHARGHPRLSTLRADFAAKQRDSTPYGRVLYPLFLAGMVVALASVVGLIDGSVRGAAAAVLWLLPLMVFTYFAYDKRTS